MEKRLFDFGRALDALKYEHKAVARKGWNGKNLRICFKEEYSNLLYTYGKHLEISNEDTKKIDTWVPSISDLFAEDWYIV